MNNFALRREREVEMSVSVLYMSMSLDGYIADPNDRLGGDDGNRLHEWGLTPDGEGHRTDGPAGQLNDEVNATGAVLVGRRTAEIVDHWGGTHHSVPIFVPSHRPPGSGLTAQHPAQVGALGDLDTMLCEAR
jgi:dihydrofolate reductase